MLLNKRIIQSYEGKRVVFVAEQDQFYHDQFGVIEYIRKNSTLPQAERMID